MKKYPVKARSCFDFICWAGVVGAVTFATNAVAQIVPDNTLGTERSTVTPAMVRGLPSDRIDGGAIRGSNLFHSFQQFNIGEGRGAYFTNPAGIENILSRVTGGSRSEILGKLGVLGNANLFLLNPNGIVFGANASLDVAGSFTATTANAIALGDQGFFSATQPDKSSLLAIAPGALFFDQQVRQPKTIQNSGNLTAGRDLTLAADNLELQGQLRSGGNLTLQAQDTLRIRDSVTAPFIASAGGKLLAQGDQSVDIFALNHPDSGLFSGGDMVLRSTNTVGGDAHYYSGGNFRIEQLNGNLGNLYSPYDPIIRSLGDVSFGIYNGSSLHILAGGNVSVTEVVIIAPDTANSIRETVTLSNGNLLPIDGGISPTLDIRAGMNPAQVREPLGLTGTNGLFANSIFTALEPPAITASATSADIQIGKIFMLAPDGVIFLTNQYQPNLSLLGGNVTVGTIRTDNTFTGFTGNSGSVLIDGRASITVGDQIITSSSSANGGNITLLAKEKVFVSRGFIISDLSEGTGQGGTIQIEAGSLSLINNTFLSSSTYGQGNSGNVIISAKNITIEDSAIFNNVESGGIGNAGDVRITASNLLLNGGQIQSILREAGSSSSGLLAAQGKSGNIQINLTGDFSATGTSSDGLPSAVITSPSFGTTGKNGIPSEERGGNISITARLMTLEDDAFINSSTFGQNRGGDIKIDVNQLAARRGGQIAAGSGRQNSSGVDFGAGGNIIVTAKEAIEIDGQGGGINRSGIFSETSSRQNAGDVTVTTGKLTIRNGGAISSGAARSGSLGGNGGNLSITATDSIRLVGQEMNQDGSRGRPSTLTTEATGQGNAGKLSVQTGRLILEDGGTISANVTRGGEDANGNFQRPTVGNGGDIDIRANSIEINNSNSRILTSTLGTGNAGNIFLRVNNLISIFAGQILSSVGETGVGNAGDIEIDAGSLNLSEKGTISAQSQGIGEARNIRIAVRDEFRAVDGNILTSAQTSGGNIDITAKSIRLQGDSDIQTNVVNGQGGNITLTADYILAFDDSDILTFAEQQGKGGNISLNTPAFFGQNYRPGNPPPFDLNGRVDINASGTVSGIITLPDTTFIQNSLTQLAENLIDPNTLLANSCIVRNRERGQNGSFLITGSGGLSVRPGDAPPASFPTGEVRSLPEAQTNQTWQPGDPIAEPQGIYRLANGKLVMSRECEP